MANIFFASDHHFNHSNILTFLNTEGSNIRTFEHVEHMNEHMVAKHNARVHPGDKTYFLGDVAFSHTALHILDRMNGEKILIKGNHDKCKLSHYLPYFKDIRGSHQMEGLLMTHIPVHPESLARWGFNVHGHLHNNRVRNADGSLDNRYFNVSVECLDDYTPISLEEIKKFKLELIP